MVTLPLHEETPRTMDDRLSAPPPQSSIPAPRLLLVDDDADTADSLAKLLRHLGQNVLVAHDGSTALEAPPGFQPEIILLDIGLPGLDGYEVAKRLRQLPGMDNTLLVALTGYSRKKTAAVAWMPASITIWLNQ